MMHSLAMTFGYIFLENFYISVPIIFLMMLVIVVKRWFRVPISESIVKGIYWFLIVGGVVVPVTLIIQMYSYPKGLERISVFVIFMVASPLYLGASVALVAYPRWLLFWRRNEF